MRKHDLGAAIFALALSGTGSAHAAVLALYDFTGNSMASSDSDPNSAASALSIGAGLTTSFSNVAGNPVPSLAFADTSLNPLGNPASDDYLQFTLTPSSSFTLTSLSLDSNRFNNGGTSLASLQYQIGGGSFTSLGSSFTINNGASFQADSFALASTFQDLTLPVTFRLFFARNGNAPVSVDLGTYVDNIRVDGTAVPLPAAVWLLGSAMVALVGIGRRRAI